MDDVFYPSHDLGGEDLDRDWASTHTWGHDKEVADCYDITTSKQLADH